MLESIFSQTMASIGTGDLLICILVGIVLGGVISFTHKLTTKTTSNFLITLVLLPVLVQVVILLINGNLGTSLAVAGAFSLIRFRSMQGNSKEIISIFWAMTIGLALGMGYVLYSIVITLIVAVLIIILSKVFEKTQDASEKRLKVLIPENLDYNEVFNDIFEKYTNNAELVKVKTTNMGSMYELSYTVKMKEVQKEKDFMDEIRCRNGNLLVMVQRQELSEVEL